MLDIGRFAARDCFGTSRRSFLTAAASLPLAWGLPSTQPASAATSGGEARAKTVIFVWLWGGPSQVDTFDPKPEADPNVRGAFRAIETKLPGVRFSEILPFLAARADKFSVVRSTLLQHEHTTTPLRGVGQTKVADKRGLVGDPKGPCLGSIVARRRPAHGLPSYVALTPKTTLSHGFNTDNFENIGAGRFGAQYHPFFVRSTTRGEVDLDSLKLLAGLTPDRLADRRTLRATFEGLRRQVDERPLGGYDEQLEGAYSLLSSPAAVRAFDLGTERDEVRNRYGRTYFGQSLLLARRLAEAEVPYVHVNWSQGVDCLEEGPRSGWDHHRNLFEQYMSYHGPVFDRAMSALLDDLDERGLLDRTLVVATGEMGRSPGVGGDGGRGHWPTASTLWAGGGVRRGAIVGATDAKGSEPVTTPLMSRDLGATICHALGIGTVDLAQMGVLAGGQVFHELFA
jgi:hypothetical protein